MHKLFLSADSCLYKMPQGLGFGFVARLFNALSLGCGAKDAYVEILHCPISHNSQVI